MHFLWNYFCDSNIIHIFASEIVPNSPKTNNNMRNKHSKDETYSFLQTLVGERISKTDLQNKLRTFFQCNNKLFDFTDSESTCDWSFGFTNGNGAVAVDFTDIEIYYLKTRERGVVYITECEILAYEK